MKKLFEDPFIYENMLFTYFSENKVCRALYNGKLDTIINRFLEIFIYEDKHNGTNHIAMIRQIYMNPEFKDRKDYYKKLNVSKNSFQRYRERYCSSLKFIIERFISEENGAEELMQKRD